MRIKRATGYNVVSVGAEAYALEGYFALFDRAIQPYLIDPSTTSTTTVVAASPAAAVAITLAANPTIAGNTVQSTAFVQGSAVTVDVGPLQETSVILSLAGLVATMQLSLAHGPTSYPIVVTGAEAEIRKILARFDACETAMLKAPNRAGIEQIDKGDVRFFATSKKSGTRGPFDEMVYQRAQSGRDLASALGIPYLPDVKRGAALSYEPY